MWQKYPLIRVLIPFIAGILIFDHYCFLFLPLPMMIFAFLLTLLLSVFWFKLERRYRATRGLLLMISICIIAIAFSAKIFTNSYGLPTIAENEILTYIATVSDPPTEKERSIKLTCTIKQYKKDKTLISTYEKCLLYLAKDSSSMRLKYGDELVFRTQLKEIPTPLNPGEMDYQKSLLRKGIRYQSFIDKNSWQKIAENKGNLFMTIAYNLRDKFLNILSTYKMDGSDYGVIAAILLGFNDKLDPELSAHYSGAGVTHVLSVSGMHVGVIYMILNFFLQFLDKHKKTKLIKFFALIFLIWLYAAITGLSPSVLRSAMMFSFIAVGNTLKQKVNTYHSLLASLLLILLLDPFVIFNIGLQLSYLAVFGIVWLQRPIYLLWIPKNKVLNWAWQLIAVSLAAQLITTPISIYYFHQFPNYFLLSNLLVVLISSFVIYAGVAVLAFSFWPWFADLLSVVMIWLIKLMNFITIYISDLPGSKTTNIDLNFPSMMVLYGFILASVLAVMHRSKRMIWSALVCVFLFLSLLVFDNYQEYQSNKFIVYALNKQTVIDIKTSNQMITLCDSALYYSDNKTPFQSKSCRIDEGVQPDSVLLISKSTKWNKNQVFIESKFIKLGNKRIALVNNQLYGDKKIPIKVDYAIVYGNPKLKIGMASRAITAKTWAFDGSNSSYKVDKWIKECDSLNLNSYAIAREGALIIEF